MPLGLNFLTNFLSGHAVYFPDINSYIGFFLIVFFVFGITFEMPVVLVLLGLLGFVSSKKLKGWRKICLRRDHRRRAGDHSGSGSVHTDGAGDPAAPALRGVDHRAPAHLPALILRPGQGHSIHSGPMRPDQRAPGELRPTTIELHTLPYAEGSALITMGETRVLCAASVEERVPPFRKGTGRGWVTAEYAMLPRSTQTRTERDGRKGRVDGRVQEIQRLIGRSLRAAVDFEALGERSILIDCDVLVADGGTRTASITGGYVALALAIARLRAGARAPQRPAALAGRGGQRGHRRRRGSPRPVLPGGLGRGDRHELRRIVGRPVHRAAGIRGAGAVLARGAGFAARARRRRACSSCSRIQAEVLRGAA